MRGSKISALFVTGVALAQTAHIESLAQRRLSLPAEQAVFQVMFTGNGVTPEMAGRALSDAGLPGSELVSQSAGRHAVVEYAFTVPVDRKAETARRLDRLSAEWSIDVRREMRFQMTSIVSEASVETGFDRLFPELLAEARQLAERQAAINRVQLGEFIGIRRIGRMSWMGSGAAPASWPPPFSNLPLLLPEQFYGLVVNFATTK